MGSVNNVRSNIKLTNIARKSKLMSNKNLEKERQENKFFHQENILSVTGICQISLKLTKVFSCFQSSFSHL